MKTSGAETLSISANIFVGQTEAPILIRNEVPTVLLIAIIFVVVFKPI